MYIRFYKGEPNGYVIRYRQGQVVEHGTGLAFWYLPYNTSIAVVPVVSQDAPFIFNETTQNFQEISIQGQLTYRLTNPLEVAKYLDFSIDPKTGRYAGKDPDKLSQRIVNAVQSNTRSGVNALSLEQALVELKDLSSRVLERVQNEPDLQAMGVLVESLHFTAVTATPEMRKALEADYRESLQQRADQAIYTRRAAAEREESKIRHNELNTEIALEERRRELVETQAHNNLTLAEAEAKAEQMKLDTFGNLAPQTLIGLALKEWAGNGGEINHLNITPDMLGQLVTWFGERRS